MNLYSHDLLSQLNCLYLHRPHAPSSFQASQEIITIRSRLLEINARPLCNSSCEAAIKPDLHKTSSSF